MPTPVLLRETAERYAATVGKKDADAYAALFTEDAVQIDPYPAGRHVGQGEIKVFIQSSFDACETIAFDLVSVHPVGDVAAVSFDISMTMTGADQIMHIRGVEVFTVNEDGLISAVTAYWGDEDVTFE
jgi:ketosteroid isomerase-like protein